MAQEFKFSSDQPRGSAGKFISQEEATNITSEDLPDLIHTSQTVTGGIKDLKIEKENKELEKPLVAVSVNNPLSWLLKWLNQLRKKQTTTFTFRLGVPLIAIPVLVAAFAGVFFGLGRVTTKETPVPTSFPAVALSRAGTLKVVKEGEANTYFIILAGGEAIGLEAPTNLDLTKFEGKRILASGIYYPVDNILKVEKLADLEVLPGSPASIPTLHPTATPESLATPTPTANLQEFSPTPSPQGDF